MYVHTQTAFLRVREHIVLNCMFQFCTNSIPTMPNWGYFQVSIELQPSFPKKENN